jgi:hypothetical protein
MSLPTWEQLPPIRRNYVRIIHPDGKVEDIWRGWLEGTMEASDQALQIFSSQKDWILFLQGHHKIASKWDLRNTLTASDRRRLAEPKISWEPESLQPSRWRAPHEHDDDFLHDFAASSQELSTAKKEQLRKEIYERTRGKPRRLH